LPAERIGGLASLQPGLRPMSASGHSRRSDGQQAFAECPLCLQWRPSLRVATNRRDGPLAEITPIVGESRSRSVSHQKGLTISYFTFSHTSVVYVAVVVAAGLLFLAGASVYALMWPKPVVPFGQMGP
jgi:hypothetical protein